MENLNNYKTENLFFMKMKTYNERKDYSIVYFEIEDKLSREEKIEFIDKMTNNFASYMLDIIKKWLAEKDSLPQTNWKEPKTISRDAWLKRNDTRKIVKTYEGLNYSFCYCEICGLDLICGTTKRGYPLAHTDKDIVDQWFNALCVYLRSKEKEHFRNTDATELKFAKMIELDKKCGHIFLDNQRICDLVYNGKKDYTSAELDKYIEMFEKLLKYADELKSETQERLSKILGEAVK